MPRAPKFTPVAASALAPSPPNLFAGTSGWAYPTWKPGFYPEHVPSRGFLHHYAAHFTSVEVNYTFSSVCTPPQIKEWLDATPPSFRFTFKAPQRITHFQRLLNSEDALSEFLAPLSAVRDAAKLGAILFQLPPNFKANPDRLTSFLALPQFSDRSLKIAFEFRNERWFSDATYDILRRHNAALCVAESDTLVTPDIATADFRYYRLRRNGGYSATKIKSFAQRFTQLAATQEVFAYFKHEDEPTGALNAKAFFRAALRAKNQQAAA